MNFAKVHFNKNGSKGPAGGQLMKHKTAKADSRKIYETTC